MCFPPTFMFYSVCVLRAFSAFFYYFFTGSVQLTDLLWIWILSDWQCDGFWRIHFWQVEVTLLIFFLNLVHRVKNLLEKVANLWSILAENPVFNPHQDCSCNHIPVHFLFISLSMVTLHFITLLKDQNHFQPLWDLSLSSVPLLHKDHKDASSEKQSTYN